MATFILFILIALVYLLLPKNNLNIKFIRLKSYILMIIIVAIIISIIIFSNNSYTAAKEAFMLWVNNVIPSLLPFFICIDLLKHTPFIKIISKLLTPIMRPIFNVPGSGAFAVAMGITSGYPTGSKICSELYMQNECSKVEAERLLAFTNTSGPLFIIGAVGIGMFKSETVGLILLLTHFLASITVGILFRSYKGAKLKSSGDIIPQESKKIKESPKIKAKSENNIEQLNLNNLGKYMGEAIQNSISTLLLVGGYIVFFAVLGTILEEGHILSAISNAISSFINALNIPTSFSNPIIKGILEVTNGLKCLTNNIFDISSNTQSIEILYSSNYKIGIIVSSFLLGFGGISVLMQTASIVSKAKLSLKPYILGKMLHAILAAIYTYLIIKYTPFINNNVISAFSYSNASSPLISETSNMVSCLCTLFLIGIFIKIIKNLIKKQI